MPPRPRSRFAAPAARDRRDRDLARQSPRHLSGAVHAGRRHEPVPLRARERARLFLQARRQSALRRRLSGAAVGPLLDRIDLHIDVPAVAAADLILPPPAEGSAQVRARVAQARDIQAERYGALGLAARTNGEASGAVLEQVAKPDNAGLALLREASEAMRRSARGYHRVLRVARTLADLDGEERVSRVHFAEALAYRMLADEMRRAA